MKKLRFINVLLVLVMVFSMIPFGTLTAYAQSAEGDPTETEPTGDDTGNGEKTGISKSKTGSRKELSAEVKTVEITMSLPAEEVEDTFDIVFVVDASNESQPIETEASNLMERLLARGLNMNIGIIKFKGKAIDMIDYRSNQEYSKLTPLTAATKEIMQDAIDYDLDTEDPHSPAGNGTNTHSPLLMATDWLNESSTPADHKYVIFMTDGRAYMWDDGSGNYTPNCIYAHYTRSGKIQHSNKPGVNVKSESDKYHSSFSITPNYYIIDETLDKAFRDSVVRFGEIQTSATTDDQRISYFKDLYNSDNPELTGESPYESYCYYTDTDTSGSGKIGYLPSIVTPHTISNAEQYVKAGVYRTYYDVQLIKEDPLLPDYEFPGVDPETGENEVNFLKLNLLEVECDKTSGVCSFTGKLNPDCFYFHVAGQEKSLYKTAHAWTDLNDLGYHTISVTNTRSGTTEQGHETCRNFLLWLPTVSEMHAERTKTSTITDMFQNLENQMIQLVGKAVVTDPIPDYLDLVTDKYDGIPFKITVADDDGNPVVQEPTKIDDNDWGFGEKDEEGVYPYEITYDESEKTFKLFINVPVLITNPVKLMYTLEWNGTGETDTKVPTNLDTTISYCPSNDPDCEKPTEELYDVPEVIYPYTASGTAEITISKELAVDDEWPEGGKATITIAPETASDPKPEDDSEILEEPGDVTFTIEFDLDDIRDEEGSYDEPKDFTYTISEETEGFSAAWKNDAPITVTVTVSDGGDGKLTFEYAYKKIGEDGKPEEIEEPVIITNDYAPDHVTVKPSVGKTIENTKDLDDGGDFTFTIEGTDEFPEALDEAPLPEETDITNSEDYKKEGAEGVYEFGEIEFTLPGTYTYTVTEDGDVAGVTNDEAAEDGLTITYEVTEDKEGKLSAKQTTKDISFTNTYDATGSAVITISKDFAEGSEWPEGGKATFTITAKDAPMPKEKFVDLTEDDESNEITFEIEYGIKDAGKTYTYTITETTNDKFSGGWKQDGPVTVEVKVTDNGDGTLDCDMTYMKPDESGNLVEVKEPVLITNSYEPTAVSVDPPVQKIIEGTDKLYNNGDFTFTIAGDICMTPDEAETDCPMPENDEITNSAEYEKEGKEGYYEFGEIVFKRPGTYTYVITESGGAAGVTNDEEDKKTITFEVTEDKNGKLDADPSTDEVKLSFTNTYSAEGSALITVSKALAQGNEWPEDGEVTFTITPKDGAPKPEKDEEILKEEGPAVFTIEYTSEDLKDKDGYAESKEFTYTIEETENFGDDWKQDGPVTVTVKVTDNGDGTLDCEVSSDPEEAVITNTYSPEGSVRLTVEKTFADEAEWPSGTPEFTFELTPDDDATIERFGEDPLTAVAKITDDPQGTAAFALIEFDINDMGKGPYTFILSEFIPEEAQENDNTLNGVTYDDSTYTVVISLADDLTPTVTVTNDEGSTTEIDPEKEPLASFENIYVIEPTSVQFSGTKRLVGKSMNPGDFSFTLTGPDDYSETVTNEEDGAITFSKITFDEEGEYSYTIAEEDIDMKDVTKDSKVYHITVTIEDNGEGQLAASFSGVDGKDQVNFVNRHKGKGEPGGGPMVPTLPKTGFSANRVTALPQQPKDLQYKPLRWTLEIPTLSVSSEIVEVPSDNGEYQVTWLGRSTGLLAGSALPGEGRVLLTGHNHLNTMESGPFALLHSLKDGDRIFVTDPENNLQIFEVYLNTKIDETDFAGLWHVSETDAKSMTLITCEDEQADGSYANRRIVAARPIG